MSYAFRVHKLGIRRLAVEKCTRIFYFEITSKQGGRVKCPQVKEAKLKTGSRHPSCPFIRRRHSDHRLMLWHLMHAHLYLCACVCVLVCVTVCDALCICMCSCARAYLDRDFLSFFSFSLGTSMRTAHMRPNELFGGGGFKPDREVRPSFIPSSWSSQTFLVSVCK